MRPICQGKPDHAFDPYADLPVLPRLPSPCRVRRAARRRRSAARRPSPGGAPDSFADLAAKLLPAVVNISSTQTVQARAGAPGAGPEMPLFPPGSPFEQFFKDFLNRNRPGGQGGDGDSRRQPERRMQSLGSGFIIDPSGLVVTNNHVIDGADEITVTLQDNTSLKAKVLGRDETRRHRLAEGETGQAAAGGGVRRFATPRGSATGCWRSATRSASAARSPPASSRRAAATSARARTTTSSRPTPRSTAATPAARCSTWTAR